MKKILTLLLILALSLTVLVGCDVLANLGINIGGEQPDVNEPNDETPDETPEVDADLQLAYEQVHQSAKVVAEKTGASYTLPGVAVVGSKTYNVNWTVTDSRVVLTVSEDGKLVTVSVPEPTEDIPYDLTFEIFNEKGESLKRTYKHVVPAFAFTTFAEYAAAAKGDAVVVTGIVTGVISKSTGSNANGLYIQDLNNEGGYYVYNIAEDPHGVIEVGMTVKVKGNKDLYNGTYEVVSPTVEILDTTIQAVEPVDFTELYLGATSLDAAELVAKQGMLVTIKGVTVLEAGDNGYYYFQLGSLKTYLRISGSNNPTTKEALEAIKAFHGANYGNTADVTGVISIYSGKFYLSPVSAEAFNNLQVVEKTDEEIIDIELGTVKFDSKLYKNTTVTLPLVGKNYTGVSFAWTSDNAAAVVNGDKLVITIPEEDTVVNLTVVATLNETVKEQTYTFKLSKTVYGVTDALEMGNAQEDGKYTEEKYLFTGIIKEIESTTYGNLYLVDEAGNEIYVYGLYTEDGKGKYETLSYKPVAGDTITFFAVVGKYNGTVQIKSGWLVSYEKGEGNDTPDTPDTPVVGDEVVFDFGENGAAGTHADGNDIGTTKTYTSNGFELVITDAYKAFDGGFDKAGNSILKFGTSSVAGTITFVVPEGVNSVVIYAARYKAYADNNMMLVNGELYVLNTNSDDGQYEAFTIDTTTNKTVTIASTTDAAKPRFVINSIVFVLGEGTTPSVPSEPETPDTPDTPETPEEPSTYPIATELKDGDKIIIGAPAYGKLLSMVKVATYYNKGVDYSATNFSNVTNDEIFVVTVNADGTYGFVSLSGQVLAQGSYSSLDVTGANTAWTIEAKDGAEGIFYLKNVGTGKYLEWYASKDNWSTYNGTLSDLFELHFYVVETTEGGETPVDPQPPVHEHNFVEGKCECGEEDPNYVPPVVEPDEPVAGAPAGSADFNTMGDKSSSYSDRTSANGWTATSAALQAGGATDMNPQFVVVGPDESYKAVCLLGKTSAAGTLTSPTLTGGVTKVTMSYTKMFTDTKLGFTVKVTDLTTGEVYTKVVSVELPKDEKYQVYTFEFVLDAPITGDFTIEVVNDCPSQLDSNKDRVTILDLSWYA